MKLYTISLEELQDLEDEQFNLTAVAMVEKPAIKAGAVALSEGIPKMQTLYYSAEKRYIVTGPILIPNQPIYRYDDIDGEHHIMYTPEAIEVILVKAMKYNNLANLNFEHSDRKIDAILVGCWIVEDAVHDKSKLYGFNVPVGTLMVSYKFNNKEDYDYFIEHTTGFSIEGNFVFKETSAPSASLKQEKEEKPLTFSKMANLLRSYRTDKTKQKEYLNLINTI